MRKTVLLLGAILLIGVSCKKEMVVDYTIISGKVINKAGDFTILSPNDRSFFKSLTLSEDGSFRDTLRVDEGFYMVHDGKNLVSLFIENGMDININADVNDFINTLIISGKGSEASNYYIEKDKIKSELIGKEVDFNKLGEEAHKAKAHELKKAIEKVLDTFNGLPEDFKTKEQRNLHYTYLKQLDYEFLHRHYAELPEFNISEGYLAELDDIDYENEEDYTFSSSYKQLVKGHFRKKGMELSHSKSIPNDIAYIETLGEIKNDKIKNELLFSYSVNGITYTESLEDFYNAFMEVSSVDGHKDQITETYNQLKRLLKGNPSPKFVNYENYNGGTTSLDDLKGKYVYIDVWATWCGPCIAEIPHMKKVEKEYQGRAIEFVGISADQPAAYDTWKEMVADKALVGIQLLADNNFDSEFIQGYLIKGIPRFILIDPNGNIVDSNAPRPSDPKLIELFNDLKI